MENEVKPLKILVTGSTGFVGSLLSEKLIKEGHQVYAQARNKKKFEEFKVPGTLIEGAMNSKGPNLWVDNLPEDLDVVVHVAGITHSFNFDDYYQTNAHATKNLIEDLKKRYSKLRFILISSQAATGPSKGSEFRLESEEPTPISHYGHSKVLAEKYLREIAPSTWDKCVVRPPLVIGPRDPAILDLFKMVKGRVLFKFGLFKKDKTYSFVGVFDLIEVIYKLIIKVESQESLQIFHSAFHEPMTYDQLVSEMKSAMKIRRTLTIKLPLVLVNGFAYLLQGINKVIPLDIRVTTDKVKDLYPSYWLVSSEKSQMILDHQYEWDFNKCINLALEDYRKRGWL